MKTKLFHLIWGVLATFTLSAPATTRYVDLNSPSSTPPYTSWGTAATNIQDAVDAAVDGDLVLVTNGVYVSQGRNADGAANCVVVDKSVTVQSVNGFATTVIDGCAMMRGVYLTNVAVLDGFAVTNGNATFASGGGVCCASTNALVANCLIIGNASGYGGGVAYGAVSNCVLKANNSSGSGGGAGFCLINRSVLIQNNAAGFGGGASGGISALNNCLVISNTAAWNGGGVYGSLLNNCIIVSNKTQGTVGGALNCPMKESVVVGNNRYGVGVDSGLGSLVPMTINSVVYYNASGNYLGNGSGLFMTNCCTTPLPTSGLDNFTNPSAFVNLAAGDFHLQSDSPCINAGNNAVVTSALDLGGNPRIAGGMVDVGAYEFQSPTSVLSYGWAQKYGLSVDGSADFGDADGDGANNYAEWRADTVPTNSVSVLRLVSVTNGPAGAGVVWQSVATRRYWLERSTNLITTPFQPVATNIAGLPSLKSFLDPTATNGGPYFYRVGVQ